MGKGAVELPKHGVHRCHESVERSKADADVQYRFVRSCEFQMLHCGSEAHCGADEVSDRFSVFVLELLREGGWVLPRFSFLIRGSWVSEETSPCLAKRLGPPFGAQVLNQHAGGRPLRGNVLWINQRPRLY